MVRGRRVGWLSLLPVLAIAAGCAGGDGSEPDPLPTFGYRVIAEYPHDPGAFTQGLVYLDGELYEGTGWSGVGPSTLRRVELASGAVLARHELADEHFGEGVAVVGDRIVQLTWRSGVGFSYDRASLRPLQTFSYAGEGWGLAFDGTRLIMSDGTARLRFLDPDTFTEIGSVQVRDADGPVDQLNELEYIDGQVYANIWQTDRIARIDPASGEVTDYLDLTGLLPAADRTDSVDVLNGIAYDPEQDRLFVTGKRWPKLFEIQIVAAGSWPPAEALDRPDERVAGVRVTGLEAGAEPPFPLLGRAVRPPLRIDLTLGRFLDPVVADRGRGVQRLVDVVLGQLGDQRSAGVRIRVGGGVMRPDAGEAVGLQLEPDCGTLRPLPVAADLVHGAEQVLDVVAVLVRDHVGLRERATLGAEPALQVVEEREVQIHLLVTRAVERADRGGGRAARGAGGAAEQLGAGRLVLPPALGEPVVPVVLHAVDHRDDPAVLLDVGLGSGRAALTKLGATRALYHRIVAAWQGGDVFRGQTQPGSQTHSQQEKEEPRTAADRLSTTRYPPAADVLHLGCVELGVFVEAHR